jgi:hypothetical protein
MGTVISVSKARTKKAILLTHSLYVLGIQTSNFPRSDVFLIYMDRRGKEIPRGQK